MGMNRASLDQGLLDRKRRQALGTFKPRSSAPPVRLGIQPPRTSPSLGTWNLVCSITGDYVGYRLPERAPDRRTDLRAHRRPDACAPPDVRPAPSAAQKPGGVHASGPPSRALGKASPQCLKVPSSAPASCVAERGLELSLGPCNERRCRGTVPERTRGSWWAGLFRAFRWATRTGVRKARVVRERRSCVCGYGAGQRVKGNLQVGEHLL